jgi:hypothetical protein
MGKAMGSGVLSNRQTAKPIKGPRARARIGRAAANSIYTVRTSRLRRSAPYGAAPERTGKLEDSEVLSRIPMTGPRGVRNSMQALLQT